MGLSIQRLRIGAGSFGIVRLLVCFRLGLIPFFDIVIFGREAWAAVFFGPVPYVKALS